MNEPRTDSPRPAQTDPVRRPKPPSGPDCRERLPLTHTAQPASVPTRCGIINLWDYRDEEFVFADGRLVLRGPNGSGKTKALEVLFPFVLDGRIDRGGSTRSPPRTGR